MPITLRDITLSVNSRFHKKADKNDIFRAIIVDAQGNQTGAGSIWYDRNTRRIWVMSHGAGQPGQVRCVRIPNPQIGLKVLIGYSEGSQELEVLSDDPFDRVTNTTGGNWTTLTNDDLQPGGVSMLWLQSKAIEPLAVFPTSGLAVKVNPGEYTYNNVAVTFNGKPNFSLAAYKPAGPTEHCLVGIYLSSLNVVTAIAGGTVSTASVPPDPAWPVDVFRLATVLITDTATAFSLVTDITDKRGLWDDPIHGNVTGPGASVANDIAVFADTTGRLLAAGPTYARGSIVRGAATEWEAYAAKTAGFILEGDGTDLISKQFDWDDMAAGAGADMVHNHATAAEGGTTALATDINRYGFLNQTETSLSFSDSTYTLTLTSVGGSWSYYRTGIKYTITGNKTSVVAGTPPTAGVYYFYIDDTSGTVTNGAAWTLLDTKVPVAVVVWNNALTPKYWLMDERHTVLIDRRMHYYEHFTEGTQFITGGVPGDYTPSSDVDNNIRYSLTEATIADEDIVHTLAALTDPTGGADYVAFYRTAEAVYAWATSTMPYLYTASGYIQYDNAGTMTEGANNKYYNWYLIFSNLTGAARWIVTPDRAVFSTLAAAQAENPGTFSWTGLPIVEFIIAYQWTYKTSSSYDSTGKCRIAAAPKALNISFISTVTASTGSHNSLSGLQGGAATDDYYHLTAAQNSGLTGGTAAVTELHAHSKLVASDGGPDNALSADAEGTLTAVDSLIFSGASMSIKGTGTSVPTLGTTTLAEKWGHIYLGAVRDVFPDNDIWGLWNRQINYSYSPIEHWHQNSDDIAWTGYSAYTGFVTPGTITRSISSLYVQHTGAARSFYYRSYINAQTFLVSRCGTSLGSECGLMVDDGANNADGLGANNFVRFFVEYPTAAVNANLASEYRSGGGAVTKATYLSTLPQDFVGIILLYGNGTRWTNWNAVVYGIGTQGARVQLAAISGLTWTPAYHGLYSRWTAAGKNNIWDWFTEA